MEARTSPPRNRRGSWFRRGRDEQAGSRPRTLEELRETDPKAAWEAMHRFGTKQVDDPWQVLGVPPGADWETITRAHRELAKRFHPDRPEVRNEEIMTLVNIAYRELQRFYGRSQHHPLEP